ncbi:MAG: HAD family phosphatase [Synechococcales bacterium]|nr:HAD family phosphatase [Synechococcales bacterium]
MSLKAVLFDFNGVIINDEPIHAKLIEQLLLEENLRLKPGEFRQTCLGRSDRACIRELLAERGRMLTDAQLEALVQRKVKAYRAELETLEKLPIYPGIDDLIFKLQGLSCKLAIVSGAVRTEIEWVLQQANLAQHFSIIVSGDDIQQSKPDPEGYLRGITQLNQKFPELQLQPTDCLAIEDTFAGIQAAKTAGIKVVGIAHTYPFHMMQRSSNWAIDYFTDLEMDRIQTLYTQGTEKPLEAPA